MSARKEMPQYDDAPQAWVQLLNEVNQQVKTEVKARSKSAGELWPDDIALLRRPNFEDMFVVLEAFRLRTKKDLRLPGVETLERCFRYPEKKRGAATRDCLAIYCGYTSYEAFRTRYAINQPLRVQLSVAQSQIHMEFQGRIRDLQQHLPHTIADRDFATDDPLILRYITLYFFLVFDEFHICKVISPNELGILWDQFYAKGVVNALARPAFKKRLLEMFAEEDDYAFFGLKQIFVDEIERLYQHQYNEALK